MDERLQFVSRRLAGEAMAELCREFVDSNHLSWQRFAAEDAKSKERRERSMGTSALS